MDKSPKAAPVDLGQSYVRDRSGAEPFMVPFGLFQASQGFQPSSPLVTSSYQHLSPPQLNQHPAARRPLEAQLMVHGASQTQNVLQRKLLMRRFGEHQISVCDQFDCLWRDFHNPLRERGIVQDDECGKVFDRIRPIVDLHHKLLMELAQDSDYASVHNTIPKFAAIIDSVFQEQQACFNLYLDGFDQIFQTVTLWKATNAEFALFLQEAEGSTNYGLAELLALPLVCLKQHQDHLEAFRQLLLHGGEEDYSVGHAIQNIRNMRRRVDVSISDLISAEKRMAVLAVTDMAGATISIVKLGRNLIHSGTIQCQTHDNIQFKEMEGFLFSDILLCCENSVSGLVVKNIVDLTTTDFELTNGDFDGQPLFGFSLTHAGNRNLKATVLFLTDEFQRNIWLMRLQQVRSNLSLSTSRARPSEVEVKASSLKYHKELLLECGLYEGSDTTEEGLPATSDSGSWDVEAEHLSEDDADAVDRTNSGDRYIGLTAENDSFKWILLRKLQEISQAQSDDETGSDWDPDVECTDELLFDNETLIEMYGSDVNGPPAPPGSFGSIDEMRMLRSSAAGPYHPTHEPDLSDHRSESDDESMLVMDLHRRMVLTNPGERDDTQNQLPETAERQIGAVVGAVTAEILQSTESGFTTVSQASTLHGSMDLPGPLSTHSKSGAAGHAARHFANDLGASSHADVFKLLSEDEECHARWSAKPWAAV